MDSRSDYVKPMTIDGIYCFSTEHAALRSKSKDCVTGKWDNVLKVYQKWYFLPVASVSQHYKNLAKYKPDIIIILLNKTCSRPDISETFLSWQDIPYYDTVSANQNVHIDCMI